MQISMSFSFPQQQYEREAEKKIYKAPSFIFEILFHNEGY